jgi:hypothetical protein
VSVSGREVEVRLFADLLVARGRKRYVAEVKTGAVAPRIDNAPTRRQLLEYLFAFGVDGVLLVDASADRVHEVVFSLPPAPRAIARKTRLVVITLVVTAIAIAIEVARGAHAFRP